MLLGEWIAGNLQSLLVTRVTTLVINANVKKKDCCYVLIYHNVCSLALSCYNSELL